MTSAIVAGTDLDILGDLNYEYIHSVQFSDVKRFDEILADEFGFCVPRRVPERDRRQQPPHLQRLQLDRPRECSTVRHKKSSLHALPDYKAAVGLRLSIMRFETRGRREQKSLRPVDGVPFDPSNDTPRAAMTSIVHTLTQDVAALSLGLNGQDAYHRRGRFHRLSSG